MRFNTEREFLNAVLDAHRDSDADDYAAMAEYAAEKLAKLDARNEARRSKPSKASLEAASRRLQVLNSLDPELAQDRDQLAAALGLTPGQVSGAMTALVFEGLATKATVKVNGKSKVVYTRAAE